MQVVNLQSIRIKIASPEEILFWSHGEVTKSETINYRTQRAERDGLFCEKIFGPEKDYECYCGKYRRIRYKGVVCDKCGVEVTKSLVRRERMGHIKLACPVSHIWFLRGIPSRIGLVLDISMQQIEKVIYFINYIITEVNKETKKKILEAIGKEYQIKLKEIIKEGKDECKDKKGERKNKILKELKSIKDKAMKEVSEIEPLRVLSEVEYYNLSLKYGEIFKADTGAETLKKIFEGVDIKQEILNLKKKLDLISPGDNKRKLLSEKQKKGLKRLRFLEDMFKAGLRPEWMFLEILPVLPPELRPMVQLDSSRYASSDLNELYRRVINRNNRLKTLLEINAPKVIIKNEKRMLQEAVDSLIDNEMRKGVTAQATTGGRRLLKSLANALKGKQGRFRQNLLGKRVDYSGRSVIVVGPKLKLNQCGIPKDMALELFKPFVIKGILAQELAYNVRGASKLIEEGSDQVWEILEQVVKDKLVLLNRAPTLHRLGIQAFQPILIEEAVIRVHPLVCKAFNADFDGDQMAVHLPLSIEAQKEAKELMLASSNLLKPSTGIPVVNPTQDITLGCYWLTRTEEAAKGQEKIFGSYQEAISAYEFGDVALRVKIKIRNIQRAKKKKAENINFIETSVGRILFNETLPSDYPFQNEVINSRKMEEIISKMIEIYGTEVSQKSLDKIKDLGFEYSTKSGMSWGMDDLIIPRQKEEIVNKGQREVERVESYYRKGFLSKDEKVGQVIEIWTKVKSEIRKLVSEVLPSTGSVFQFIDSGAKGSWDYVVQMSGMKGSMVNPAGQIIELPIKSSFKSGLSVLEFFISTHGARKGLVDTALQTSSAGYLTRRLVDASHEVMISEQDCGDKEGITILKREAEEIDESLVFKILGRIALENIKIGSKIIVKAGEIIDWGKTEQIIKAGLEVIRVRSPLMCKCVRGICQKCYGWELGSNQMVRKGRAVGIIAAQSIGEPGTQLTMRTFHAGGVAGGADITTGLPRVQEVFEVRAITEKAEISQSKGKVLEITPKKIIKIQSINNSSDFKKASKKKKEILEYKNSFDMAIWVKPGEIVEKGQQLCEGNLDLRELFKLAGEDKAKHYIVKEIQKIYFSQGAAIHDKHVELIARQMFSRMRIKDAGDSPFTVDEIVEKAIFFEENERLRKEKKKLAKGVSVLLGITRVALTTDSFLSAASFQETSRVLIQAAIKGKEDRLRGLKENVMVGKLISKEEDKS